MNCALYKSKPHDSSRQQTQPAAGLALLRLPCGVYGGAVRPYRSASTRSPYALQRMRIANFCAKVPRAMVRGSFESSSSYLAGYSRPPCAGRQMAELARRAEILVGVIATRPCPARQAHGTRKCFSWRVPFPSLHLPCMTVAGHHLDGRPAVEIMQAHVSSTRSRISRCRSVALARSTRKPAEAASGLRPSQAGAEADAETRGLLPGKWRLQPYRQTTKVSPSAGAPRPLCWG